MATSTILMQRDKETAVLPVATSVTCSKRKEGSFSLWVTEESDFGKISHTLVKRTRSVEKIIEALMGISDWSDLSLSLGDILSDICPRLAGIDRRFAEAVEWDVIQRMQARTPQSEAA